MAAAVSIMAHLDSKLNWREHIVTKRKQINLRSKDLYWLIGRRSQLPLENKILIYKAIIKPIWTYGIELWGYVSTSIIAILQRSQSKILRTMTDTPWYVSNKTIHEDLGNPFITNTTHEKSIKYYNKLEIHTNPLVQPLLQQQDHQ